MADLYLYDDVPVLRNSLGIKDENTLDRIEAEQSRANMMLLYERGFHDLFGIAMMRKFPMIWKVHFPHYTSRIGIV